MKGKIQSLDIKVNGRPTEVDLKESGEDLIEKVIYYQKEVMRN